MRLLKSARQRLAGAHPDHGRIAKGMAWVMIFVLLGKLVGAAKEMIVAYRYGVSEIVDAYLFVFNVVNWLPAVWLGVLTAVLVPLTARMNRESAETRPQFHAELLGFTLASGVLVSLLSAVGLIVAVQFWPLGLNTSMRQLVRDIAWQMAPLSLLTMLIALASAQLLSMEKHVNTLFEGVPSLILLFVLIAWSQPNAEPLIWGTVIGYVFHLVALGWHVQRGKQLEKPVLRMQSPVWKAFWTGFGALTFSQFLMSLTTMIDQFSAVSLGAGANATLGYATRLLALALGLLSTAIARAVLPVFSDAVASGNYRMAAQQARMWAGGLFIVCVVGLPLAWWLTPMAVSLLYERGAFSNQDTIAVAQVVRYGLLQVPFYVSAIVLIQLLLSQGKVKAMAAIALLSVAVKVVGNTLFAPMFGAAGIALATSLMYASSTIAFWLIALRRSDAI